MKVLVCSIGVEDTYIGVEDSEVRELIESKAYVVPWRTAGPSKVVASSGKLHVAASVNGVFGEGEIRIFVILKSGYALGVKSVVGYENLNSELELPDELSKYFKGAFKYENGIVYLIDLEKLDNLPPAEFPTESENKQLFEENEQTPGGAGEEFLVLKIASSFYGIRLEDVTEILEADKVNIMKHGNLYGFVQAGGRVVPVVSKWKVCPRWIIVVGEVAVPCETFEHFTAPLKGSEKRKFLEFKDDHIEVLEKEELIEWI